MHYELRDDDRTFEMMASEVKWCFGRFLSEGELEERINETASPYEKWTGLWTFF